MAEAARGEPFRLIDRGWHPLATGHAPDWADGWGQDQYGVFAEIWIGQALIRLRWIPPGGFSIGSADDEPGRYGDEGPQTEIAYFGLVPEFVGKGFGKLLLEDCIDKAWELAETRIWLHTCTLDSPSALPNYLNRGFEIFKEEDLKDMIPASPLEPWPAAAKPAG